MTLIREIDGYILTIEEVKKKLAEQRKELIETIKLVDLAKSDLIETRRWKTEAQQDKILFEKDKSDRLNIIEELKKSQEENTYNYQQTAQKQLEIIKNQEAKINELGWIFKEMESKWNIKFDELIKLNNTIIDAKSKKLEYWELCQSLENIKDMSKEELDKLKIKQWEIITRLTNLEERESLLIQREASVNKAINRLQQLKGNI